MAEDWQRRFSPPLRLPDGRTLKTLADAREYLTAFRVPRDPEHKQLLADAIRTILNAAGGRDVMLHASIAVGRWARR